MSRAFIFRAVAVLSLVLLTRAGVSQLVRPESLPQGFILIVEDVTKTASSSRPIYLASGANSWDPGDPEYALTPRSDTRWQYVFEGNQLGENVEFKFTLGGWASVELDSEGQQIPNRTLPEVDISGLAPGEQPVIELVVPQWNDGSQEYIIAFEYRPLNVTGTVKRLEVAGGAGLAEGSMRDLLVWLPPGYDAPENADRAYPVLYMMDGQNLFQNHAFIPGEWHADETATALIEAGVVDPFIIVGVPHDGNDHRLTEYLPPNAQLPEAYAALRGQTAGDDQVKWLTDQVMPRVERAFRVSGDREHTGIGGASAGGIFAIYAAMTAQDHFGLVLAESPYLTAVANETWQAWASSDQGGRRMFFGMGSNEMIEGSEFFGGPTGPQMRAISQVANLFMQSNDIALSVVSRHEHNEHAWAERLPAALTHLFGRPTAPADDAEVGMAPRPEDLADPQRLEQGFTIVVEDASGVASADRPIYFASNENNWNAQDPERVLTQRADGTWAIDLDQPEISQRVEFKFTLGGWEHVETDPSGENISNRTLPMVDVSRLAPGERPEVRFTIVRFPGA
jgi:enterochelin esterase-like enzyme